VTEMDGIQSNYLMNNPLKQESKVTASNTQEPVTRVSVSQLDNLINLTKSAHENTMNDSKIAAIKQQIQEGSYFPNLGDLVDQLMVELLTSEHF
jgi:anti-sigma28 factor (negative regulator of flagellin synthesis)